jgi:protein-L-isoaspartate(D-aspartate) O-methyltransferase
MFESMSQRSSVPDDSAFLRKDMVERQIRKRGIADLRVLSAMTSVPRHAFVPADRLGSAYADTPLPIGHGQTISQPFMVAAMADALLLPGTERVLEIGAGSGYQSAVLSLLAREVIAIETLPSLAASARERLACLGYSNVRILDGDGSLGWMAEAPYDAILVSAAAPSVPQPLIDQLAEGGRLAVPVGDAENQQVLRITKRRGEILSEKLYRCRFVPLVGEHGWRERAQKVPNE